MAESATEVVDSGLGTRDYQYNISHLESGLRYYEKTEIHVVRLSVDHCHSQYTFHPFDVCMDLTKLDTQHYSFIPWAYSS